MQPLETKAAHYRWRTAERETAINHVIHMIAMLHHRVSAALAVVVGAGVRAWVRIIHVISRAISNPHHYQPKQVAGRPGMIRM